MNNEVERWPGELAALRKLLAGVQASEALTTARLTAPFSTRKRSVAEKVLLKALVAYHKAEKGKAPQP